MPLPDSKCGRATICIKHNGYEFRNNANAALLAIGIARHIVLMLKQ